MTATTTTTDDYGKRVLEREQRRFVCAISIHLDCICGGFYAENICSTLEPSFIQAMKFLTALNSDHCFRIFSYSQFHVYLRHKNRHFTYTHPTYNQQIVDNVEIFSGKVFMMKTSITFHQRENGFIICFRCIRLFQ